MSLVLTKKIYTVAHKELGVFELVAGAVRFDRDFVIFVGDNNSDIIEAYHADLVKHISKDR